MKKMTVIPAVSQIKQGRIRVAAYCRVSTSRDDQEHSYETQVRYFTNLYRGSETSVLVGVYDDELQTAFTALCDKLHTHNAEIIGKCYAQLTELQRLMEYGTAEGANQLKTLADLKEQKHRLATLYRKRFITTEKYDREVTEIDMQIS